MIGIKVCKVCAANIACAIGRADSVMVSLFDIRAVLALVPVEICIGFIIIVSEGMADFAARVNRAAGTALARSIT